jgi:BirA family biotin operon repressor/biotin-[acetyl-CoA-carboxylase] ligase
LYLSLGWRFEAGTPELSTLPLLVAVCLARALADVGLRGHGVKWPNDILVGGRKLAGVLVESQSAGGERFVAIIGVGVNIRMPDDSAAAAIDRPWTDLSRELGPGMGSEPDANAMAVALLERLLPGLKTFESEGFASFREDWARFDLLSERLVRLTAKGEVSQGVAQGIDRFGSLLVETADGRVRAFHHGEASIVRD